MYCFIQTLNSFIISKIIQASAKMGQQNIIPPASQPFASQEAVESHIKLLFQATSQMTFHISISPVTMITSNLSFHESFKQKDNKLHVNPTILKCLFHPKFKITIQRLLGLLIKELTPIYKNSLIFMIPRQKFINCLLISNFCLYFTNETLLQKINLMNISTDVHQDCKKVMTDLQSFQVQLNHNFFQHVQREMIVKLVKVISEMLIYSINLHHKVLTRTSTTLNLIDNLSLTLFVLLAKLSLPLLKEIEATQEMHHSRIIIGSYFLGYSLQHTIPSIYELSNLFLWQELKLSMINISSIKTLPTNLFKHLPIVNSNNILNWIIVMLLHSFLFIKDKQSLKNKLNVNRISAFLFLSYCFEHLVQYDKQIQHLFSQICLQTKVNQIQRIYVSQICLSFSKIEVFHNRIIKKFGELSEKQFIIKNKSNKAMISPSELLQYFIKQHKEESFSNEIQRLQCRYITQVIFHKSQILYDYSDSSLWNMILMELRPKVSLSIDEGGSKEYSNSQQLQ